MHYIKKLRRQNKVDWAEPRFKKKKKDLPATLILRTSVSSGVFILNVIQIVRCHMRSHLMKRTKEQDKFEGTKIWICNYIIKIRTLCLLSLRALNHSLLFAYLFKGSGINSLTLNWFLLCFTNFISGAKNVLVISYRSEGLGRR